MWLLSRPFPLVCVCCATSLLLGCSGDPQRLPGKLPASVAPQSVPPPAASLPADTAAYVFDIPALVNLTADQIKVKLGKPLSDEQESDNEQMHSLNYRRQGYKLSIDYEVKSRRVIDFYFTPVKSWQKYTRLLGDANITRDEDLHLVHKLNEENGLYEGIGITPDGSRVLDRSGNWVPGDSVQ